MDNRDLLWAGTALRGGIAGQQRATCGALSAMAVAMGLRNAGQPTEGEAADKTRQAANAAVEEIVKDFIAEFGAVNCLDLLGVDFSVPGNREKAREEGLFEKKCHKYVQYIVSKACEMENQQTKGEPS